MLKPLLHNFINRNLGEGEEGGGGGGISDLRIFWISDQSLIKGNCHNSRTSDNIEMKLGPVTKLHKINKTTSKKKLTVTSCQKIVMSLSFFQFMANLEQSRSRIMDK